MRSYDVTLLYRLSDGAVVPGHLDPASYGPLMLLAAAAIVIGVYICAIGTLKELPHLSKAPPGTKRFTIGGIYSDITSALGNRHYLSLLLGFFFLSLTIGIGETIGTFMGTFYGSLCPAIRGAPHSRFSCAYAG